MKINRVDLGYNPLRAPSFQQMLGDVFIEHGTTISYERGAGPRELTCVVWVAAQTAIAGYAPGTQGANEALARWLEELATNPDLNDPVLVNWSSLRALPQDGWWHIVACQPNYQWTGAGRIPVTMTFRQRGALNAPVSIFWGGGALASVYTAVPVNLVGLPQNAVGIVTATRSGGEGGYPYVKDPPSASGGTQGVVQFLASANQDDWVKAGSHVYDAMAAIGTNAVPASGFLNANWLEVLGVEHSFIGDLVFTNGLLLVTISLNGSVQLYAWTRAGAWVQVGAIQSVDSLGNVGLPLAVDIWKVGFEEVAMDVTFIGAANSGTLSMRLQRGQRLLRLGFTPKSYTNSTASSIRFVPSVGGGLIVFNESLSNDQTFGSGSLAATATNPYASALLPNTAWPFLASLFYQTVPAQQPGYGTAGAGLNLGDTSGPTQYGTRLYGLGVTPYANVDKLQGNGFSGTLGTGWSSVADGGTRNGASTAKCASGTLINNADTFGTAYVPEPGTYDLHVRLKVTSAAGAVAEMTVGLWDNDTGAFVASTTLRANQAGVGYTVIALNSNIRPTATKNMRFRAVTAATLGTDWFIDEAWLAPASLDAYLDGPEDLARQYLFERTTRFPVV